ncbi:MAG: amidinotransferase [Flavobacteriales bacterium]|nr:hypothetical protein [Flavobacteriales bacterium]MCC6578266.1 amidinotransferase [Flavobacteriales bacterium]NUQ15182.1 amidinotransferase [Flavobacteriales bacterium]
MSTAAPAVILVRPTGFGHDPQTAASNAFQRHLADADVRDRASAEFDGLLEALGHCGIGTTVLDPKDPAAPNAVFPNNWFSTHDDGTVLLYPMCTPSRRAERDHGLDRTLAREGYRVHRLVDLSGMEREGRYLEGTGSLVIDRAHRTAYAALSPRTSERALNTWCGAMGGHQVPFLATMDGTLAAQPVYHTNVVMSIGEGFAVVCLEAMPYPVDREDVRAELERAGKEVLPITLDQMHRFVGNLLQLRSPGGSFILLSTTAFAALAPHQRHRLEAHGQPVPVEVPTIEAVGGGSVRCMLAENFLDRC